MAIIAEEMRRVITYFEYHATWWENRASIRSGIPPDIVEGLSAYAHRQASILRQRATLFAQLWSSSDPPSHLGINWTARTVDSTDDDDSGAD